MKNQVSLWNAVYLDKQMSHIGHVEGRALGKIGAYHHAEPGTFMSSIGAFSLNDPWGASMVSMLGTDRNYPSAVGDNIKSDVGGIG